MRAIGRVIQLSAAKPGARGNRPQWLQQGAFGTMSAAKTLGVGKRATDVTAQCPSEPRWVVTPTC